ncbi:MAG TPA: HNH endonuclease signature motif containing protein [Opitutaceae bacterium]|nr:HNH endonuclease signature motif containing protein [Opitutaceae bacterium]
MSYWWVNHKQTFRQEFQGGYVWSPKTKAGGQRNPFYDFMRLVRPGDVVFSYAFGRVQGAGLAKTYCYTSPRPDEFGHIGQVWDAIGWRVDVGFVPARIPVGPREYLDRIQPYIGIRYSPLNASGTGRQSVYLAAIPDSLGIILEDLIGFATPALHAAEQGGSDVEIALPGIEEWEARETERIETLQIGETERRALVLARKGQGRFKENVSRFEHACRITRVTNPVHLIASHIKPWRESDNAERLAAGNGLLLTPSIDHLFDRGFISFDDNGDTLISPVADPDALRRMGVNPDAPPQVGGFNSDQRFFLNHHRTSIFLAGAVPPSG